MKVIFYHTEKNNSLKADVYVYGIVLELGAILFMTPVMGTIIGLMVSFSSLLQYGSMGISMLVFIILWKVLHASKNQITLDKMVTRMIYAGSIKYVHSEAFTLIKQKEIV